MNLPARAILASTLWCLVVGRAAADKAPDPAAVEFFEKKVRPVLARHCYRCHSARAEKLKGGLLLDSRKGVLEGGDSGPALVPGQPEKSRLIEAVGYRSVDLQMPPKGRLPDRTIADLTAWVKMGAPWPGDKPPPAKTGYAFDLARRKAAHWAWRSIQAHVPPEVKSTDWPRGPLDRFLLARLEARGLPAARPADRRILLRRVYFDLVGLPPTPGEVDAFVRDASPGALARVVDRLLASPRFGERWARHWLDLVRYAETRGHEYDEIIPNAHQYRDYVIRALNADVPYHRFVAEHIAGDLLPRPRLHPAEGFNESVLGTGFWFLGEEVHSPVDTRQDQADRFDNRIDVMTKTFLGLTVACARCHDHKFDAISTRDYYALFGFLESSTYRQVRFDALDNNRRIAAALARLHDRTRPPVQRSLAAALRPGVERMADYLLAAANRLQGGTEPQPAKDASADKLDPAQLARWVAHLRQAARDRTDPLHLWARAATDPNLQDSKRLRDFIQQAAKGRGSAAAAVPKEVEVIIDFARCPPNHWLPDGVAFGTRPSRAGDLRLGGTASQPDIQFLEQSAAQADPVWNGLRAATGAENDPGAIGGLLRAGRTISTPVFTLTRSKLFYLVRGRGMAYAAVDQHVLIKGPLHAQLVTGLNAGDRVQWIAHDLAPYKGQPVHVELTAAPGADFAVAQVVQADHSPPTPDEPGPLLPSLGARLPVTLPNLATAYQRRLLEVADRLKSDQLLCKPQAADDAPLANWLIRHADLFLTDKTALHRTIAAQSAGYFVERARLAARIQLESRLAPAIMDLTGFDEHVFIRGSPRAPGENVPRRFLEALAGPDRLAAARGSGRLELARQITDPWVNPLLARVMVNRIWHHLFGRGLVASVDNFGVLGEPPTHPELLDYLAARFIRDGWSVMKMIRLLVLSSAYRMSSRPGGPGDQADPEDLLLHRMRVRRLEGESIRDAMLVVSGRFDGRLYGPSVPVFLTPFLDGRGRPASGPLDGDGRRSLYTAVRRNFLSPLMLAFDTPIPFSTVGRRTVSNVPAQALILMNDPFVHQQAAVWARRVLAGPGTSAQRITHMYESAFSRPPTASELAGCLDFLDRQARLNGTRPDNPATWADLAHVLFNVKEFIFVQ
jgi:cytochrome c553